MKKAGDRIALNDGADPVRTETRVVAVTGVPLETTRSKAVARTDDRRMDGKRITVGEAYTTGPKSGADSHRERRIHRGRAP